VLTGKVNLARELFRVYQGAPALGPNGEKGKPHTRGLLRRIIVQGGLQHCIGKEVSRFEQGKGDFIENIDDDCIHYDGGRVAANDNLIAEISEHGLRRTTKVTGLDRKTIRAILTGKKVKASTLAKVVMEFRKEWSEECLVGRSE
jgi:hypothetical protein